jgi:SAM-dependent methyltransferase
MTIAPEGPFERDYFEKTYRNYARQNPPRKLRVYRRLVEGAAPPGRVPRILDIGCAFGAFLSELDPAWDRCGMDVSQFAIDRAAERVPAAAFARADITTIPFPGPFDIVTAFDVIEHVPSLEGATASIRSKLSSNGHFLFVVPVYDGPAGLLVHLLDRDETHLHKRSRRFWLDWAQERFQVVEWWGLTRYLLPGGYYVHLVTRAFREFTPAIAVLTRRRPS